MTRFYVFSPADGKIRKIDFRLYFLSHSILGVSLLPELCMQVGQPGKEGEREERSTANYGHSIHPSSYLWNGRGKMRFRLPPSKRFLQDVEGGNKFAMLLCKLLEEGCSIPTKSKRKIFHIHTHTTNKNKVVSNPPTYPPLQNFLGGNLFRHATFVVWILAAGGLIFGTHDSFFF